MNKTLIFVTAALLSEFYNNYRKVNKYEWKKQKETRHIWNAVRFCISDLYRRFVADMDSYTLFTKQ